MASIGAPARQVPDWIVLLRDLASVKTGLPTVILLPDIVLVGETVALLCAREGLADLPPYPDVLLSSLVTGQRVRILPNEGIYEFGGARAEGFLLHPLGRRNRSAKGSLFIPKKESSRLEPTRRKRPIGKPNRHGWAPLEPSGWDRFARSALYGNAALARLSVVLVGIQKNFSDALQQLGFARAPSTIAMDIADGLPWGKVDEHGDVELLHPPAASGYPLIAIARDHMSARRLAEYSKPGSLLIVSARPDDAWSDRTSVETLAERHACLVLAPGRSRENFLQRRKDNWLVAELSGLPVLTADRLEIAALDRVAAASGWMAKPSSSLAKRSRELEAAFGLLDAFNRTVEIHLDSDDEIAEAARILRRMFFQVSDWLALPSPEDLEDFGTDREDLLRLVPRLHSITGQKAADAAKDIVANLARFADATVSRRTTPKGEALQRLAESALTSTSYRQMILTGQRRTAAAIVAFLDALGAPMKCITPVELAANHDVQRINGISLMKRESFMRLVDPWAAPEIMFLGYQHEVDVYENRLAKRHRMIDVLRPDAPIVAKHPQLATLQVSSHGTQLLTGSTSGSEPLASIPRPSRHPEPRGGEQTRMARFCRFTGRSWMAMTDDHSVARLQAGPGQKAQVKSADCRDIEAGDLILVREGGDRDIVRELAEQIAGREVYAQRREQADHWRRRLRSSGCTPQELCKLLREEGLERGFATLRYWMAEVGPIGPNDPDVAIPLIAAALGENSGSGPWKSCCKAIHDIRRYHLNAGARLTHVLMAECGESILEHAEHETAFKLSLGTVWLLEIERLEAARQPWPYTQLNRIQWESDTWRQRLLRRAVAERTSDYDEALLALLDLTSDQG